MERACISTTDLLGCINEYCENLGFSTIIVANEDKIQSGDENNIKYNEIKEKIVQRTVRHYPEYRSVVDNVIENMKFKLGSYKSFLEEYIDEIIVIFSGKTMDGKSLNDFVEKCTKGSYREIDAENRRIRELLKKRPHNIRSLKCALQDFERVYELLVEYDIPEQNKWLFSFIAYTFSARAGLVIKDKEYESIFYDDDVSQLYPGYYSKKYMIDGIKKWISDGEWNEEAINCQMSFMKERYTAITSLDKARINSILDLEEEDMLAGYPELLNLAYEGKLDLNDYVYLLCNSNEAKEYDINIPTIDWDKVQLGVEIKIDELLQSHEGPSDYNVVIGDESKNDYTDSQWKVYETIEKYRNGQLQLFENNRNLYIELMNEDPYIAYEEIINKRLDCFSDKMAEVTLNAFKKSSNADKNDMPFNTKDIIRSMMSYSEFKGEQTETALNALKCGLKSYLEQHCSSNKNSIAAAHANRFIQTIDILLAELKK